MAPFIYGLYWKKTTKLSVWVCFIVGIGLVVSNMIFKFIASPINAGAIAMIIGFITVPVVSLVTPKLKKESIDSMFSCYKEDVSEE